MATQDLEAINISGDLAAIQLGGLADTKKVLVQEEVDAKIQVVDDKVSINAVDIGNANAAITINANNITAIGEGTSALDKILLTDQTGTEPAWTEGQLFSASGGLNFQSKYTDVTLQVGQEQYIEVSNATGTDIPNGSAVYFTGLSGGLPAIGLAQADAFSTGKVMGVTTMIVPNAGTGLVTTFGTVSDLNTNVFTPGATLYLSETASGGFTETAPDIATIVGTVIVADLTAGKVFVKPSNFINLPTVTAYMGSGVLGTNTITTAYQDVINYVTHGNVFMAYSETAGTITIPTAGVYKLTINLNVSFDAVGNSEENFVLRLNGSIGGNYDIPVTVTRNSGAAIAYPSITFSAATAEVFKLQLGGASTDLTTMVENMMTFDIESKHIR